MNDSISAPPERSLASLVNEFKDALRNRRLPFCECLSCNHKSPFPRTRCPQCNSGRIIVQFARGLGRVYAFTVLHRSKSPIQKVPIIVAIIELIEGVKVNANIRYVENLAIGDNVKLQFEDFGGASKPVFHRINASEEFI
jgi:uncharacterized OB-fold protein